jgi:hypothetical protein
MGAGVTAGAAGAGVAAAGGGDAGRAGALGVSLVFGAVSQPASNARPNTIDSVVRDVFTVPPCI